jgi:hypothetical protein
MNRHSFYDACNTTRQGDFATDGDLLDTAAGGARKTTWMRAVASNGDRRGRLPFLGIVLIDG